MRRTSRWRIVFGASLALHLLFFFAATRMGSLIGPLDSEPRVIVNRIPLYLPPDVLTQKAPNRDKVSKHIDLADLLPSEPLQARRAASEPESQSNSSCQNKSRRNKLRRTVPDILAEAPNIALNQTPAPLPPGCSHRTAPHRRRLHPLRLRVRFRT